MRVIRLKMYQEMARFNNPSAPRGADCYPLPPFSTVNGFIHSMQELYIELITNMKLSKVLDNSRKFLVT